MDHILTYSFNDHADTAYTRLRFICNCPGINYVNLDMVHHDSFVFNLKAADDESLIKLLLQNENLSLQR